MTTSTMPTTAHHTCELDRFILEGTTPVPTCVHAFAIWMQLHDTTIALDAGEMCEVRTVFTGIPDAHGCLFQTTVTRHSRRMDHFDEPRVDFAASWRTHEEAMRGHRTICRRI